MEQAAESTDAGLPEVGTREDVQLTEAGSRPGGAKLLGGDGLIGRLFVGLAEAEGIAIDS
jgi:hypothetical protein